MCNIRIKLIKYYLQSLKMLLIYKRILIHKEILQEIKFEN